MENEARYGDEPTYIVESPQEACRFRDIALELTRTYIDKNKDYGNSFGRSVEKYGLVAALTRISDRHARRYGSLLYHDNNRNRK